MRARNFSLLRRPLAHEQIRQHRYSCVHAGTCGDATPALHEMVLPTRLPKANGAWCRALGAVTAPSIPPMQTNIECLKTQSYPTALAPSIETNVPTSKPFLYILEPPLCCSVRRGIAHVLFGSKMLSQGQGHAESHDGVSSRYEGIVRRLQSLKETSDFPTPHWCSRTFGTKTFGRALLLPLALCHFSSNTISCIILPRTRNCCISFLPLPGQI